MLPKASTLESQLLATSVSWLACTQFEEKQTVIKVLLDSSNLAEITLMN